MEVLLVRWDNWWMQCLTWLSPFVVLPNKQRLDGWKWVPANESSWLFLAFFYVDQQIYLLCLVEKSAILVLS